MSNGHLYAIEFENGVIKVGRSGNVEERGKPRA